MLRRRHHRLPPRRRRLQGARRPAAAALLAVAAAVTVDAATAGPPTGVPLAVAARDLAAGHALTSADLTSVDVPPGAVPDGALSPQVAAGSRLAAPLRRGEPVTDARLAGPGLLVAAPDGALAVPVRVQEPAVLALIGAGDEVAVLAGRDIGGLTGAAGEVLVPSAVVLHVPDPGGSGLLDGGGTDGAVVVLALDRPAATRVADAVGLRPLVLALLP